MDLQQLVGDDFRHIEQHAHAVDAPQFDDHIEEELPVHLPLGIDNAVAEAGFQFGCHGTRPLVQFDAVLIVDIVAHDVVAGNGVAAVGHDKAGL